MGGEFLGTNYVDMLRDEDLPDLETIVTIRGTGEGAVEWSEFLDRGESVSDAEVLTRADAVSPDDISDLIFTSGTTGKPKAVMTCHGQNLRAFADWSDVVSLTEGDRYLIAGPFLHSFGFKAGILACLMRGATMLPQAVFDAAEILERVGRDRISVLPGAPAFYQSFLAHPDLARFDISNLRLAVMGAASIPVELVHRMRDDLGIDLVITGYGLTEACGIATMCRYDDDIETIATTSGRAIPDVEVLCVDGDGKEVPRGEAGEIVVRGYNIMKGYFDDEAATAEAIDADGWLHTGDIGVMEARGYVKITDRIKDMFIMGGFNCYPAEIEGQLFASGDYAQVAIIGVPDERMGEVAMAFVVPAPGRDVTPEGVIAWSRENMANYKVPRFVQILTELPLNASGKVSKLDLRERAKQLGHG